ncbi:hypothetical protein SDC9_142356 [bioreactor metagenome]|uniref:Uncharacterized protein n=1 Tax=bioreactor metagenome TaxID=1076179 RepID=A0A645E314_9ZZZZ
MLGAICVDDDGTDRARAGQQRDGQRHHRNTRTRAGFVRFFGGAARAVRLGIEHLEGQKEQQQPTTDLQRGNGDAENTQQHLAEQRRHRDHDGSGHRGGIDGGTHLRGPLRGGEAEEHRDRTEGVDQSQ